MCNAAKTASRVMQYPLKTPRARGKRRICQRPLLPPEPLTRPPLCLIPSNDEKRRKPPGTRAAINVHQKRLSLARVRRCRGHGHFGIHHLAPPPQRLGKAWLFMQRPGAS